MIRASGVGKTAYFLYPNLEYACANVMSFLALDTKDDLARNYGAIARDIYGYRISAVDLWEPTRSDGNNLLTLINRNMDEHRESPREIKAKAKAEKYAKILAISVYRYLVDRANKDDICWPSIPTLSKDFKTSESTTRRH